MKKPWKAGYVRRPKGVPTRSPRFVIRGPCSASCRLPRSASQVRIPIQRSANVATAEHARRATRRLRDYETQARTWARHRIKTDDANLSAFQLATPHATSAVLALVLGDELAGLRSGPASGDVPEFDLDGNLRGVRPPHQIAILGAFDLESLAMAFERAVVIASELFSELRCTKPGVKPGHS